MWIKSSVIILVLPALSLAMNDVLWDDDKGSKGYNCQGHVTDAICCQDSLCNGLSEDYCKSGKAETLCHWSGKDQKCKAFRDKVNNVCCQSKPLPGCYDLMKGRCPTDYQVPENCCSKDGAKWSSMFTGMKPGKVCCNAPCHDLGKNHCPLPSYCKKEVQSRTYSSKVHSTDVGINPLYLDHHYKPGKHYADVYATGVGNEKKYDDYETKEITVDDIVDMLIKAMDNDGDIIKTDDTLYSSPIGKYKSYKVPYVDNYIDPKLYFKKALDPLRNFQGYDHYYPQPSYGYGHGYGHQGFGHGPGYGHGYSHGYGGYGSHGW